MTVVKETRHIFEVGDILVVRVTCVNCKNTISMQVKGDNSFPDDQCPMCRAPKWLVGSGGPYLLKALRAALDEDSKVGGIIHLEINGDPEGKA